MPGCADETGYGYRAGARHPRGINLGGGYITVAEHLLDCAQIRPIGEEMCCERMAVEGGASRAFQFPRGAHRSGSSAK